MKASGPHETPPSLLLRIRDVDNVQAWQTFVDLYTPLIYGTCRRRGLQDADAADVAQEVLGQVARSIRTFDYQPERGRFRDWLSTVIHSKLVRFREKKQREVAGAGGTEDALAEVEAPAPDTEWTAAFNARVLQVALGHIQADFEPATWQAFTMVWQELRPAAEAAQATGLTVSAVYVAKSRVLKRLREEVQALAEEVLPLASA